MEPPVTGADVGDVYHPLGIGFQREEVPGQVVTRACQSYAGRLASPATSLRQARQTIGRHQSCDAVEAGRFALVAQRFVHARCAHHAITGGVVHADLRQQSRVVLRPRAGIADTPVVEAARRHFQAPAHQPDRVLVAVASDRLLPQDDSLAKNAAASRKKSRSLVTFASCRLSARSSWSRATPAPTNDFLPWTSNFRRNATAGWIPRPDPARSGRR